MPPSPPNDDNNNDDDDDDNNKDDDDDNNKDDNYSSNNSKNNNNKKISENTAKSYTLISKQCVFFNTPHVLALMDHYQALYKHIQSYVTVCGNKSTR